MVYRCPHCQSPSVQALPLAHDLGTTTGRATSWTLSGWLGSMTSPGGPGWLGRLLGAKAGGHRGVGLARTGTATTAQTALAARTAPPSKRRLLGPVLVIALALVMLGQDRSSAGPSGATVWGGLLAALGGWWGFRTVAWNRREWPRAHATWRGSFLCLVCGIVFLPASVGSGAPVP